MLVIIKSFDLWDSPRTCLHSWTKGKKQRNITILYQNNEQFYTLKCSPILVLWEDYGVDLAVVVHKMNLQSFSDVVWQVGEVLPVLSWNNHAGYTSTAGLAGKHAVSADGNNITANTFHGIMPRHEKW